MSLNEKKNVDKTQKLTKLKSVDSFHLVIKDEPFSKCNTCVRT